MHPADFYTGLVAEAYGKLKSSRFAAEPYAAFIAQHGQPALELGCGEGEPMLDLCAAGLEVEGVDSSLDMVQRCRAQAEQRGLVVSVHHQRVEDLSLGRRYASIYLAGPTFTLLTDDDTALRALRAIRAHLIDDGAALVPLWVPEPTPTALVGVPRTTGSVDGVELTFTPVSETYDVQGRTRSTTCRYERLSPAGTEVVHREWIIHWHTPPMFRVLCDEADLEVVDLVDDDTGEHAVDTATFFTATLRRRRARTAVS